MTPKKSLLWRYTMRFVVVVHSDQPPSLEEWTALLDEWDAKPELASVLVYSEGGAPNARQRVRITDILRRRKGVVAVLSRSALARAAGLAMHLFRPELRVFGENEFEPACEYLGATDSEREELLRVLAELKAELGLSKRTA